MIADLNELEEDVESSPLATEIKRKITRQRSRISESSTNLENGLSRSVSIKSINSIKNAESKKLGESLLDQKLKTVSFLTLKV